MTKILLVEDDPLIADLYTTILVIEKFKVETLLDGRGVVDYVKENLPDLIVLDLMMPHMSGVDVLDALKDEAKIKDIPVIVFSNLLDAEVEKQVLEKGAVRYAVKSDYPPARFTNLVKEVLGENGK